MIILQAGDRAPDFEGIDQDGNRISLADFARSKLVLFFYPQDDTPTCTIQACNLRDNYTLLKNAGIAVLGISPDSVTRHKKFEEKYNLPFSLVADPDHQIIDRYGVWGEKQLYGRKYMGLHRTTFLVNGEGTILKVFLRPKNKQHAAEILEFFAD
jgi:thioredoxin-dependent peroxiredoxin